MSCCFRLNEHPDSSTTRNGRPSMNRYRYVPVDGHFHFLHAKSKIKKDPSVNEWANAVHYTWKKITPFGRGASAIDARVFSTQYRLPCTRTVLVPVHTFFTLTTHQHSARNWTANVLYVGSFHCLQVRIYINCPPHFSLWGCFRSRVPCRQWSSIIGDFSSIVRGQSTNCTSDTQADYFYY